jgi:hypothetical protein
MPLPPRIPEKFRGKQPLPEAREYADAALKETEGNVELALLLVCDLWVMDVNRRRREKIKTGEVYE